MFNCDKVKNNEVQGYLFFTPMSRSGAIFFALAQLWEQQGVKGGTVRPVVQGQTTPTSIQY